MYIVKDEEREKTSFIKTHIVPIFVLNLVIRINYGLSIYSANTVKKTYVGRLMELEDHLVLEFQWFGANNIIMMTVTSL